MEVAKTLTANTRDFTACGVEYVVHTPEECLTPARYNHFQKLRTKHGFGMTIEEIRAEMTKAVNILNDVFKGDTRRNAMHAVLIYQNLLDKLTEKKGDQNQLFELMICTLFINEKGEDVTKWSEAAASKKIENWINEGYNVLGFFLLVQNFVLQLNTAFESSTENG